MSDDEQFRKDNNLPPPGCFLLDEKPGKFFRYDSTTGKTLEVDSDGHDVTEKA